MNDKLKQLQIDWNEARDNLIASQFKLQKKYENVKDMDDAEYFKIVKEQDLEFEKIWMAKYEEIK